MAGNKYFVERLKNEAQAKGLTQRELAQRCGVTESSMSRYFNGERVPKATMITKIAKVLHVSTDSLLGYENDVAENPDCIYERIYRAVLRNAKEMSTGQRIDLIELILDAQRGESRYGRKEN